MALFSPVTAIEPIRRAALRVGGVALAQQSERRGEEIDRWCQDELLREIASAFPDEQFALCAEERTPGVELFAGGSGWRLIVDPIDGSANYSARATPRDPDKTRRWSVAIAMQAPDTHLALGLIVFPALENEIWIVLDGQPPTRNGQPIERIQSRCVGLHSRAKKAVRPALDRPIMMPGCATWALTRVLSGELAGYICDGTWLWDIAAGLVMLRAAGGDMVTADGDPLPLTSESVRIDGLHLATVDPAETAALLPALGPPATRSEPRGAGQ